MGGDNALFTNSYCCVENKRRQSLGRVRIKYLRKKKVCPLNLEINVTYI